ncbi:MAG: SMP-30/gluconolactonase/LRE family protein [Ilumatobacteraceae bacterium]
MIDDHPVWDVVVDHLRFPEGLRWRQDTLYFSDVFDRSVHRVRPGQSAEFLANVPGRPSGLGFLPDGTLLAVSMRDRSIVTIVNGSIEPYADLSGLAGGDCNDMLVDPHGRAYVGNFGYDYAGGEERRAAQLVLIEPDRGARIVAENVWFPNGMILSPDGRTLMLAETSAERITLFTVDAEGSLSDRRTFEDIPGIRPDGIALDSHGAVWVASPGTAEIVQFDPNGEIVRRWPAPGGMSQGCALGGSDGNTLFVACSPTHDERESEQRLGCILSTRLS